jgi:hypothetical protein
MSMLTALTWLTNFLSGGLLTKVFGWVSSWITSSTNLGVAKVTTAGTVAIAETQAASSMAIADKGWWLTAAMKPTVFYLFMLHVGAVVLDTTFKLGWSVNKLPTPYDVMEANVIYVCLGIVGAWGLTRLILK